jgi:divalent metal cation (Fe/Co/Zn/Cd) transporter
LLLVAVSLLLARESRSLLMGEGVADKTAQRIRAIVTADPVIYEVTYLFSTYQSPEEILLVLIVTVNSDLDTTDIDEAITNARARIKKEFPLIKFVIIQPELQN